MKVLTKRQIDAVQGMGMCQCEQPNWSEGKRMNYHPAITTANKAMCIKYCCQGFGGRNYVYYIYEGVRMSC